MLSKPRSEGITPSERYLSKLCGRSFLSLWSYTNLHTDESRKGGKGVGQELCDLLVVFGNDVIIFSDRYIKFNRSADILVGWKRWFKRAVLKSANQLYGAEAWLRRHPNRIYLDPHCENQIPISLPKPKSMRVHRIAVALGIYEACKEFFGGKSLGSLMVNSSLVGEDHFDYPFHIGHVNPEKGFVHVLEDFTLNAVLREVDTISDFVAYLSKKEQLFSREKPIIIAAGEEQLLSLYLTRLNKDGEHDFDLPDDLDGISLDEGFWEDMIQNPQYRAKKEADRVSYAWDRLIEHFIKYGSGYDLYGENQGPMVEQEPALRVMASEPRIRRRQLGHALVNLMEIGREGKGRTRLFYSNDFPDVAYLFLILPPLRDESYERYHDQRRSMLLAYCKVAKLLAKDAKYIVGIATEPLDTKGATEDLVALDVNEWTPEMQNEAEGLQKEFSLFLDTNIQKTEGRVKEYPDLPEGAARPSYNRPLNRRQRRALEAMRRRSKNRVK